MLQTKDVRVKEWIAKVVDAHGVPTVVTYNPLMVLAKYSRGVLTAIQSALRFFLDGSKSKPFPTMKVIP